MFSVHPQENAVPYTLLFPTPSSPGSLLGDQAQHCGLSGFVHWPLTAFSSRLPSDPSMSSLLSVSDRGLHTSQANTYSFFTTFCGANVMSIVCMRGLGCHNRRPQMGWGVNDRNVFSHSSGGWRSRIRVLAGMAAGEASLHGLHMAKTQYGHTWPPGVSSSS